MLTLTDITFYTNKEFENAMQLINSQEAALGYISHIKKNIQVEVIKHASFKQQLLKDDVPYYFFQHHHHFFSIPFKTFKHLYQRRPDVILVQGLSFPFQVILIRLLLGRDALILAQHHGERPSRSFIAKMFYRLADKCVNLYLFNTPSYAKERLQLKLIRSSEKIKQLQEGSNAFSKKDKQQARAELNIHAKGPVFIWVGRLNDNKDPLTILKAFARYILHFPCATLYMIYQTEDLLARIKQLLQTNNQLQQSVHLLGKIEHTVLEKWYNAADYFISGSLHEYGGFAVLEAMACGCIPIVTSIPTMRQYLQNGRLGYLFQPRNANSLLNVLQQLNNNDIERMSRKVADHFSQALSFNKIASQLYEICQQLHIKQAHNTRNSVVNTIGANG